MSGCKKALREANEVKWTDPKVRKQICLYLSFGVPNIFILLIPQLINETMALTSGFFGVQ